MCMEYGPDDVAAGLVDGLGDLSHEPQAAPSVHQIHIPSNLADTKQRSTHKTRMHACKWSVDVINLIN
jgi:hypothetical protein